MVSRTVQEGYNVDLLLGKAITRENWDIAIAIPARLGDISGGHP